MGEIDNVVRNGSFGETNLHATKLVAGHENECRLAVGADNDLKLRTCVHGVSRPLTAAYQATFTMAGL